MAPSPQGDITRVPRIAVTVHLFNFTLVEELARYLGNVTAAGYDYDLFIAVPYGVDYSQCRALWPAARFYERENRGFDIASFLVALVDVLAGDYDLVLKLHTKSCREWRDALYRPLLSSPERVRYCVERFNDPSIGMIGCEKWRLSIGEHWGNNDIHIRAISEHWGVPVRACDFIGGTIFWMRLSLWRDVVRQRKLDLVALARTMNTAATLDWAWYMMAYPELRMQGVIDRVTAERHWHRAGLKEGRACNCLYARIHKIEGLICDGMLEHAYERFFGLLVAHGGQRVVGVTMDNLLAQEDVKSLVVYHPQYGWAGANGSGERTPDSGADHGTTPGFLSLQPHADLGLYASATTDIQKTQLAMIEQYGGYGVCYHITPTTTDFLMRLPTNYPFCLGWAPGTVVAPRMLQHLTAKPMYIRYHGKPVLVLETPDPANGYDAGATGSAGCYVITDHVQLPTTRVLQYRGVVLGDQGRLVREKLRIGYLAKLSELSHPPADDPVKKSADSTAQTGTAPPHPFLVIRSWNDWTRQVALEPSRTFGYRYLEEWQAAVRAFD